MLYIVLSGLLSAIIAAAAVHRYYTRGYIVKDSVTRPDGILVEELKIYRAMTSYRMTCSKDGKVIFAGDSWLSRGDACDEYRKFMKGYKDGTSR
jgi:hypothetical protein